MAQFRLGNEWKAEKTWLSKEEKMCRVCFKKEETMEHVTEECEETKKEGRNITDENGRWIAWMYEIKWKRKNKEMAQLNDPA